jgi:hypothetical protein
LPEPAPEPEQEPDQADAENPASNSQHVVPNPEIDLTKDDFRALILEKLRTAEDDALLAECLSALEAAVHDGLGGEAWRVSAFGSVVTKLGTRGCDFDVTVFELHQLEQDDGHNKGESDAKTVLGQLGDVLDGSDFLVKGTILHARVPILKLQYKGQEVDLSVNNTRPLKNTRLLRSYASLDEEVAVLVVAVKHWAKERSLCGAANGHLSSYAFSLMVIYFLQVTDMGQMPCLQARGEEDKAFEDDATAEKLARGAASAWSLRKSMSFEMWLSAFFAFYAGTPGPYLEESQPPFNWGEEVVSVRLGRRLSSSSSEFRDLKGRQEAKLHIEDPFERSRNLRDVMWTHPSDHEVALFDQISWIDQAYKVHAIARLPQMMAGLAKTGRGRSGSGDVADQWPPFQVFPPSVPPLGNDQQSDLAAGMPWLWSPAYSAVETAADSSQQHRKGAKGGRGMMANEQVTRSWGAAKAAWSSNRAWQKARSR